MDTKKLGVLCRRKVTGRSELTKGRQHIVAYEDLLVREEEEEITFSWSIVGWIVFKK